MAMPSASVAACEPERPVETPARLRHRDDPDDQAGEPCHDDRSTHPRARGTYEDQHQDQ
jgi:hypothetical protein